jgi:elongation factor 3
MEVKSSNEICKSLFLEILKDNNITNNFNERRHLLPVLEYLATLTSFYCKLGNKNKSEWEENITRIIYLLADENVVVNNTFFNEINEMMEKKEEDLDIPDGEGKILCNVKFKLAYGGKILLNTTNFHVRRGRRYGLLGHNGCGKSTLMRAIATGQLAGFPGAEELMSLKACYVEHDIDGSNADIPTIDFCMQEPILAQLGREAIYQKLLDMEFTDELINKPICNLSGGWKMKLALARAMLIGADLLLLDEPTNHLDVDKISWLVKFLSGPDCENVTSLIVSHDSKFLDRVLSDVIHYENMRLKRYTGNLTKFVEQCPIAKAYFSIQNTDLTFNFPKPGNLDGVKSRTKAIIKLKNCTFTYPGAPKPTILNASIQCSQASRIACIGPNGAGKSTLIKLLVGELKPDKGCEEPDRHPNCRVSYVAQHAFHHIEKHINKSPIEYIQWRFSGGVDKEVMEAEQANLTDLEKQKYLQPFIVYTKELTPEEDERGNKKGKGEIVYDSMEPLKKGDKCPDGIKPRVISNLVGRISKHGSYEYEVKWKDLESDHNLYVPLDTLEKYGFDKQVKEINEKIAAAQGNSRPLTFAEIQKHLEDVGLDEEFSRYGKLANLSGGQKVKVVIGAAMWYCPHLLILDEPTNYLDRDSLGALSKAINNFEGGVLMISHNAEFYGDIAPEVWNVPGDGFVYSSGEDYMDKIKQQELADKKANKNKLNLGENETEILDGFGNKIEIEKKVNSTVDRSQLKQMQKEFKLMKKMQNGGDDIDEELFYKLEEDIAIAEEQLNKEKLLRKNKL